MRNFIVERTVNGKVLRLTVLASSGAIAAALADAHVRNGARKRPAPLTFRPTVPTR